MGAFLCSVAPVDNYCLHMYVRNNVLSLPSSLSSSHLLYFFPPVPSPPPSAECHYRWAIAFAVSLIFGVPTIVVSFTLDNVETAKLDVFCGLSLKNAILFILSTIVQVRRLACHACMYVQLFHNPSPVLIVHSEDSCDFSIDIIGSIGS